MSHKVVEYIIRISASDRYRHLHIMDKGRLMFFRVQYETQIGNVWYPVVRYDTAHGFAHRDILNLKGEVKKNPII